MPLKTLGIDIGYGSSIGQSLEGWPAVLRVAQITLPPKMVGKSMQWFKKVDKDDIINLDTLILHASLMINLANEKHWGIGVLRSTLTEAKKLKIVNPRVKIGVVVHIGRGGGTLDRVIEQINSLSLDDDVTLYMENAAGQGQELGKNMEELKYLFDNIDSKIKLCIDTQHSFASGLCKWQSTQDIQEFFNCLEECLPGKFTLLHLNDSEVSYSCCKDRHENIGKGFIWKENFKPLVKLLRYIDRNQIPTILETKDAWGDWEYLQSLKIYDN